MFTRLVLQIVLSVGSCEAARSIQLLHQQSRAQELTFDNSHSLRGSAAFKW